MEVQKEAQRIMTLSVWKMYHSRMQRGGLRLHRSLQLSLVMRSARELYLSAKVEAHEPEVPLPPVRSPDPRLHQSREAEAGAEAAPPTVSRPPRSPWTRGRRRERRRPQPAVPRAPQKSAESGATAA